VRSATGAGGGPAFASLLVGRVRAVATQPVVTSRAMIAGRNTAEF
jgi:hypothetical protein